VSKTSARTRHPRGKVRNDRCGSVPGHHQVATTASSR